jgi:hypothetical protein
MNPEKFYYSKWSAWGPLVYMTILFLNDYYNHKKLGRPFFSPPWQIVVLVIVALYLIYHCYAVLLPMLRRKTFMELDNEKMDVRHKNKTIYWCDIREITTGFFYNCLVIKLKNKKKIRIYLNNVKGDDDLIYRTILSYYKLATDSKETNIVA